MVDLGNQVADERSHGTVVGMLEIGPFERKRPGRPGGANIGKGLLDADGPPWPIHDEDQIQIAVSHFTDLPIVRLGPKKRAQVVQPGEHRDQTRRVERAIAGRRVCDRVKFPEFPS